MSAVETAYRAWRKAADKGYGKRKVAHPTDMDRVDQRIRALKAKYEEALRRRKEP